MTILLVDDERLVRLCTESMLREILGDELDCAQVASAAQAEQWLSSNPEPDICIVDYKMPLCNGLELIAHNAGKYSNTKWILMSGYDMTDTISAVKPDFILSKPASLEDFSALLKAVSGR